MANKTEPPIDQEQLDTIEFYKLMFPEYDPETIAAALQSEYERLGETAFQTAINKYGSYQERLRRMYDAHTNQTEFVGEWLDKVKNASRIGNEYSYVGEEGDEADSGFSLKSRVLKIDKSLKGASVKGKQAKMLILATNNNVKKVYLYNSGFNVVLRGPTLGELNIVFNTIGDDMTSYGNMLGMLFYMHFDFTIKGVLTKLIETLVISSNLEGFDTGHTLRDNISLLDYPALLLNIGSLMFKDGYDLIHTCTNDACRNTNAEVVDLNAMQLTDFSKIPKEQLRWLSVGDPVTPDALKTYRDTINADAVITVGAYEIHRSVPSISAYQSIGQQYNDNLAAVVSSLKSASDVDQFVKYNYSLIFSPWIDHIVSMGEDGEPSFMTSDREAIELILSELEKTSHRKELIEKMDSYISSSTVTGVGYLATPCESCGQMPNNLHNGFVPFDAQNSFFSMLVTRLIQQS